MKAVDDPDIDRFPEPGPANDPLASWYAPGLSDELGDRLLMFDNSSAPSLELLRFRGALSVDPVFEAALRERVERVSQFTHPSFATVRAVERLGPNDGLALLSNFTPGRRLSEVLPDARGPAFATALIQLLAPALASLRQQGGGTGHGALAADRIVITPEGRLVIVEHVIGPALEALKMDPDRLRSEFGVAVPPSRAPYPRLDIRADYFQLGIVALSLLVGRQVRPDVSLEEVGRLIEHVASTAERESPVLFRRLRVWLERALQLNGEIFRSPSDAQDALNNVAEPVAAPRTLPRQPARAISARTETRPPPEASLADPVSTPLSTPISIDGVRQIEGAAASELQQPDVSTPGGSESPARPEQVDATPPTAPAEQPPAPPQASPAIAIPDPPVVRRSPRIEWHTYPAAFARQVLPRLNESIAGLKAAGRRAIAELPDLPSVGRPNGVQSLAAVLALCVMGQGLAIATLLNRRASTAVPAVIVKTALPGAHVFVDGRSVGNTPLQLHIGSDTRSIRVVDARPPVPTVGIVPPEGARGAPPKPEGRKPEAVAIPPRRSGGIRLATPFDVEVYDGDSRLGSSSTGIVSAPAGRRELELVNSRLGYRVRRVVFVRAGRVTALDVSPPNGLLSINASPWAEVWIDGKPAGETPLANLSVPLGDHEIVFRHPELGEQRRTALVRMEGVTRVSANFQR